MLEHPVVLFDGVCNYCNWMVNFAIRNDRKAKLRFAPLQSETGKSLVKRFNISPEIDSVILIDNNKVYTYSSAAIRIAKYLDWPARALYALVIVPPFIRQPFYKWFARHRYQWFGKREACMIPTVKVKERFLD